MSEAELDYFIYDTGIKRLLNRHPDFFWTLLFPDLRATIEAWGEDKELVEGERALRGDGCWHAAVEEYAETAFFWCEAFTRYAKEIPIRVMEYKTGKHNEHLTTHKEIPAVYAGAILLSEPPKTANFRLPGRPEVVVPHAILPRLQASRCLELEGVAGAAMAVLSFGRNLVLEIIVQRLNDLADERHWRAWAGIIIAFAALTRDPKFIRNLMNALQVTSQEEKIRRLRQDLQPVLDVIYQMRYDEGYDDGIDEGDLKASLRIASELLADGMSVEKVARITKLNESQVAALMQKNEK
jgi:hypothetical protein